MYLDPEGIAPYFGKGPIGLHCCHLYDLPLVIFHTAKKYPDDRPSVLMADIEEAIWGPVLLFKDDGEGPNDLYDFDVRAIRDNLVFWNDVEGSYLRLENVTEEKRDTASKERDSAWRDEPLAVCTVIDEKRRCF